MKTNKIVFNSINIKEGVGNKLITFTPNNNLIYSTKNSVGKSTLLRLLIYSLGYDIPSTKKMQFSKLELTVNMDCSDGNLTLTRIGEYFHLQNNTTNKTILYLDLDNILSCIYGVNNLEIINNILATFYLDQEYGWTFLNKGKILGKLSFNGEELIRGLTNIDCSNLNKKLTKVQQKIQKYKYMQGISKYKAQIVKDNKTLFNNKYDEQQKDKLTFLKTEKSRLINELNELDDTLKKNKSFKDYINSYKLRVKNDEGIEIPVNEKTIIGYDDNNDFIIHKKKIIAKEILHINKNIKELEKEVSNFSTDTETLIEIFDSKVANINIDQRLVEEAIEVLKKEQDNLKKEISEKTKSNKDIINTLYKIVIKYSERLEVKNYINPNPDSIFNNDLKSLSGAILHKIVFIFKLAYIKIIKDKIGLILPIILDSPSGRETNKYNIDKMIEILNEDYKEHQIIIASIFDNYNLDNLYKIEINDSLMENTFGQG